jgi:uncharacterized protein YqhQ
LWLPHLSGKRMVVNMKEPVTVDLNVGGQAVIEGVMMRSPHTVSTAVRKPNGQIVVKSEKFVSLTQKHRILGVPLIRGLVSFAEMLVISIKTLNYSAEMAMEEDDESKTEDEEKKSGFIKSVYMAVTMILALALGFGLFFFLPLWLSQLLGARKEALTFNLIAGCVRVFLFIAYVWIISRFGEFKKIFQYHGAEHKSIFTYEAGRELTVENVKGFSTKHPRCGTSFIMIVVVFAILVYSVSDTIFYLIAGVPPTLPQRVLVHLILLPLVAGGGYELLKISGKTRDRKITQILSAPGLWIQNITTREPNESQLEVALVALKNALGEEEHSEFNPQPISEKPAG